MKTQERDRLAQIKTRLSTARQERAQARQAVTAAETLRDADAAALAQAKLDAVDTDIEYLQGLENAALSRIATGGSIDRFGGTLAGNLDAQRALAEISESSAPLRSNVAIGSYMAMDDVIGLTGGALRAALDTPDGGGRTGFLGIASVPQVPTSLLDFFTSVPFDGRTADLLRRSGVANAAIAPHGSVKPQAALVYAAESVRAVTVASWVKANRQDLDDVEALTADIGQALSYGVLRAVERLLLDGANADADGAAVPGILDAPFVPTVTATNLDGAVGQMKAQLIATGVVPNFAGASAATIEREESRVGSDGHPVGTISEDGRVRRLPLISTEALSDGQVLVGDSVVGARLGVRQGIGLVAGQEADDMTRNRVTILVEGRWSPIVMVPTDFAIHDLTV